MKLIVFVNVLFCFACLFLFVWPQSRLSTVFKSLDFKTVLFVMFVFSCNRLFYENKLLDGVTAEDRQPVVVSKLFNIYQNQASIHLQQ